MKGLFGDVKCLGQNVEQFSVHNFLAKQVQSTGPPFTTETPALNIHQNYWVYFLLLRDFFSSAVPNNLGYHNISSSSSSSNNNNNNTINNNYLIIVAIPGSHNLHSTIIEKL
jgi:hypothetical protein